MSETYRSLAERSYNCASQLRSIIQSLEYWKDRQKNRETEWLLEKAKEFIERAIQGIDEKELMKLEDER